MKKRHFAIAVLVILCSTTVFAAPRNDPQSSPFARTFDRLVQVINHIVHPLDDISASPPHP
ncbi:MAG TPA: hypothetical protein VGQ65_01890 [Thermoanaerobaculia bacterium]|jgi:hypothetical protein|nr:hypothetical protein [Thermoanaerobaculia bacterium]